MINDKLVRMASNIINYNKENIPLYISRENISYHLNSHTMPHWHEDLEILEVVNGDMYSKIIDEVVHLSKGDVLIIPGLQMHYSYSVNGEDCTYNRILFHPELLTRNKIIASNIIEPLLDNYKIKYFYLSKDNKETGKIRSIVETIMAINDSKTRSSEMEIIGYIHIVLGILFNADNRLSMGQGELIEQDLYIQRQMITYIHEHFSEKITLDEIAASGNVCRSKCCMIFKKYIQMTPVSFLNLYRLEVSRTMLRESADTVSSISQSCGFANQSYFNKMFLNEYDCTPIEFRMNERQRMKVS